MQKSESVFDLFWLFINNSSQLTFAFYNTNEHIRIIFWYEWMSEYIRIKKLTRTNIRIYSYQKIDTNECPNIYLYQKYSNIWIFEYIRHTLLWTTWMSPISVFVVLNSCEILFCCESVNVQILCKNNGEEIEHPRQNLTKTSKTINFSQVSLSERGKEKWKAN